MKCTKNNNRFYSINISRVRLYIYKYINISRLDRQKGVSDILIIVEKHKTFKNVIFDEF